MDLYSDVIPLTKRFQKLSVFCLKVMADWAFKIGLLILKQPQPDRLISASKETITFRYIKNHLMRWSK